MKLRGSEIQAVYNAMLTYDDHLYDDSWYGVIKKNTT